MEMNGKNNALINAHSVPVAARPRTIYEDRGEAEIAYIITDEKGMVVAFNTLTKERYNAFLDSLNPAIVEYQIERLDLNPFLAERDFRYEKDIRPIRQLKIIGMTILSSLMALCMAGAVILYLTSRDLGETKKAFMNHFQGMETSLKTVITGMMGLQNKVSDIEAKQKQMSEAIEMLNRQIQTQHVSSSPQTRENQAINTGNKAQKKEFKIELVD